MLHPLEIAHVFTPEQCRGIITAALAGPFKDAALVGGLQADNARRARIFWLDDAGESASTFRRLLDTFADANRSHFDFALDDLAERMQVAWYGAETGGFFDWHVDFGDGPIAARRKLTMVIQLSEADVYEGGALETNADGVVRQASRLIGSALVFPSFVLHRVAPVTRGERYSLTLWSHGPAFR
jgi:PKHD-type hydroxylase